MINGQTMEIKSNGSNNTPRRILVVENDANHRYIFDRTLRHAGYQVYPAATLEEADNLLAENRFDLLLCDVCMDGGRYGTDLVQERSAELTQHGTHIVMVSSDAQYRYMCEGLGLDIFMKKPVGIRPLVALVNRLTA